MKTKQSLFIIVMIAAFLRCQQSSNAVVLRVFDAAEATGIWIKQAADENKTVTKR